VIRPGQHKVAPFDCDRNGANSTGPALEEEFQRLTDGEIAQLVTGKTVTNATHCTDRFKPGGAYEGFMNKRSTGSWKVRNGQLGITRVSERETCDEIRRSRNKLQRRKPSLSNVRDDVTVLSE
jgi:hypothetical protein